MIGYFSIAWGAPADVELPTEQVSTTASPVLSLPPPAIQDGSSPLIHDLVTAALTISVKESSIQAAVTPFAFSKRYLGQWRTVRLSAKTATTGLFTLGGSVGLADSVPLPAFREMMELCTDSVPPVRDALVRAIETRVEVPGTSTDSRTADVLTAGQRELPESDPDLRRLAQAVAGRTAALGQCREGLYDQFLARAAFDDAFAASVDGSTVWWAFRNEPEVTDSENVPYDPTVRVLQSWNVGLSLTYHPSHRVGLFFRPSYQQEWASRLADAEPSAAWVGGSVTGGIALPYGGIQTDGWQASVVPGLTVEHFGCVAGDCTVDLTTSYGDEAFLRQVARGAVIPFLDLRTSGKAQLRLAVPITWNQLADPPPRATSDDRIVVGVVPTVSVGVTAWKAGL